MQLLQAGDAGAAAQASAREGRDGICEEEYMPRLSPPQHPVEECSKEDTTGSRGVCDVHRKAPDLHDLSAVAEGRPPSPSHLVERSRFRVQRARPRDDLHTLDLRFSASFDLHGSMFTIAVQR